MLLILIGKNVYTFPLPGTNTASSSRTEIVLWIRVGNLAALHRPECYCLSRHVLAVPI